MVQNDVIPLQHKQGRARRAEVCMRLGRENKIESNIELVRVRGNIEVKDKHVQRIALPTEWLPID